jgi:C1A family cysteine protease
VERQIERSGWIITRLGSGPETTGALLFRNSWGKDWGDDGYGWLPYEYVLQDLAVDWWSLLKGEWIDTGAFGLNGE